MAAVKPPQEEGHDWNLIVPEFSRLESPGYRMYRVNTTSGRYYVAQYHDQAGTEHNFFAPSATTIIKYSTPLAEAVTKAMCERGWYGWWDYLDQRAAYGTAMHILIAEFIQKQSFPNLKHTEQYAKEILSEQYPFKYSELGLMARDLCKDLLAFAKFAYDMKMEVLAVELPLTDFDSGFGIAVDLVAYCDFDTEVEAEAGTYSRGPRKGQVKYEKIKKPETFLTVIDFKSGRKGFYEGHEVQMAMAERALLNSYDFSDVKIKLINWRPTNWRKDPDYEIRDQTGRIPKEVLDAKITVGKWRAKANIPDVLVFEGELEFGKLPSAYKFESVFK